MLILALDTSSAGGSLALARNGHLLDETTGDPSLTHGERLPGELAALLDRHGLTTGAIDRYAVAAGPGFTAPPERPGDVGDSQADISRARALIGYEPTVDLAEGLSRLEDAVEQRDG